MAQNSPTPVTPHPTALCLSGGGFRATLFHLGALKRLNELGLLSQFAAIISVSGGSILNGFLAANWAKLKLVNGVFDFNDFDQLICNPVEKFCSVDLRTPLLLGVRMNPANLGTLFRDGFSVRGNYLAHAYERTLPQLLNSLPARDGNTPRFIFVATNVSTGLSWQFHCGPTARMGDYHSGYRPVGNTSLGEAMAASSAFPPGFSALRLKLPPEDGQPRLDPWGEVRGTSRTRADQIHDDGCQVLLSDGGVYDNLGLEAVINRGPDDRQGSWTPQHYGIYVSDAQQLFQSEPRISQWILPRLLRTTDILLEQVSAVRKRWIIERVRASNYQWRGLIWKLGTEPATGGPLGYGPAVIDLIERVRTDLNSFNDGERACLINQGYWSVDSLLRITKHMPTKAPTFIWPAPAYATDTAAQAALARSAKRTLLADLIRYLRGC